MRKTNAIKEKQRNTCNAIHLNTLMKESEANAKELHRRYEKEKKYIYLMR